MALASASFQWRAHAFMDLVLSVVHESFFIFFHFQASFIHLSKEKKPFHSMHSNHITCDAWGAVAVVAVGIVAGDTEPAAAGVRRPSAVGTCLRMRVRWPCSVIAIWSKSSLLRLLNEACFPHHQIHSETPNASFSFSYCTYKINKSLLSKSLAVTI